MSIAHFNEMIAHAKGRGKKRIAVAVADDGEVLAAVRQVFDEGLADVVLTGDQKSIEKVAAAHHIALSGFEIIDEKDHYNAASLCCKLVREKSAAVVAKGLLDTSKFMKAILNKETGLNCGKFASHVAAFQLQDYPKLLFITDVAINVRPTLEQKIAIIQNAVELATNFGIQTPLVAACAAVEKVNAAAMPETVEAAILAKMNDRGQTTGCAIDGPLGLDNALSEESAKVKKIHSQVAGRADIILCPDMVSGNFLYKAFNFVKSTRVAAIVAGTSAPVVLTSRADNHDAKYLSMVLGLLGCG